ncbi:hypothetical protein, partial [Anabaena sp. UHCC 0204]|uniref:hypothetical protein n=1 Tax=Anabaena sp. UHCC 0204 TaxID=2590009 RepID=UPI001445E7B1
PNSELENIQTFAEPEETDIQTFSETPNNELQQIPALPTTIESIVSTKPLGLSKPMIQQSSLIGSNAISKFSRGITSTIQNTREGETSYFSENNVLDSSTNNISNSRENINTPPFRLQKKSDNSNQQHNQQSKPSVNSTEIPNSWSSIDELMGNSHSIYNQIHTTEPSIQMSSFSAKEKENFDSGISDNLTNTNTEYYNSDYSNTRNSHGIESLIQMASATVGQETSTNQAVSYVDSSSTAESQTHSDHKDDNEDSKNLEILAREIYGFIRQRLEIERERSRNYY